MSAPKVRRQNHSCEQCRRSRKACDGYALNICASDPDLQLRPCSYCTRTRKQCSFNLYWGEAQPTAKIQSTSPDVTQKDEIQSVPTVKRQRVASDLGAAPTSVNNNLACGVDNDEILHDMLQSLSTPVSNYKTSWHDSTLGLCDTFTKSPSSSSFSTHHQTLTDYPFDLSSIPHVVPGVQQDSSDLLSPTQTLSLDSFPNLPVSNEPHNLNLIQESLTWLNPDVYPVIPYIQDKLAGPLGSNDDLWPAEGKEQEIAKPVISNGVISPFHADYRAMTSTNNTLITDSLLGIYHDVLENNLACWLAEDTCPYKGRSGQAIRSMRPMPLMSSSSIRQACGATWSNRIYSRVVQLDRVAQRTGQLRLTKSENRAASKALSLAIMAFATQWSHSERHRADFFPGPPSGSVLNDSAQGGGNGFEDDFKQSTWEQARQALQECSELESYRVVYAELVFGLAPRPTAPQRRSQGRHEHSGGLASRRKEVMKMLAIQNQPTYIERATRKAHSMKFRLDAAETGFSMFGDPPAQLLAEDRATIGLLYWLAVMLDTVSSSISEKPVALADEDCQHEAVPTALDDTSGTVNRRWEARLFVQDDLEKPSLSLQWPCDYHEAAEGVARSAPVKVLLFRYISYLQNVLRKRDGGKAIEDIISGAMLLYKYWNTTYGTFFRGLIRDYDTIPSRIKSWFVCIVVPWNLGALMLADLIEFVDNNNMGLDQTSRSRTAERTIPTIRNRSANELADIALVTTPAQHYSGPRQLPDLHFAVNQGSLLTEPWTILLVNAFSKAALYHLEILNELETHTVAFSKIDYNALDHAVRRIRSCARCLWFLGRKTSVAGDIAAVFFEAINHYETPS